MRIPGEVPKITGAYEKIKNTGRTAGTGSVYNKKDHVSISGLAKEYQVTMKALKDVPDIRQDKVNDLSLRYGTGNYDVAGRDIADKLISRIFDKKA
jgi:negative regulator of flagellin synthesis FlgM